ncbi:protein of unknown function (plasmid) [Caballeronia sp. S22]
MADPFPAENRPKRGKTGSVARRRACRGPQLTVRRFAFRAAHSEWSPEMLERASGDSILAFRAPRGSDRIGAFLLLIDLTRGELFFAFVKQSWLM